MTEEPQNAPAGYVSGWKYQRACESKISFAKKLEAIRAICRQWGADVLDDNEAIGMVAEIINDEVTPKESLALWENGEARK